MTSKQFTIKTLAVVFSFMVIFPILNIALNDFGLFYNRENIRIWTRPKTSKHLFSYRYIPDNFKGILIGSSVSTNVDTKLFAEHKIYNLSMEGANTTELEVCATNVLQRGELETLIISLSPYMTKNCGIKGSEIGPQEYLGSIFSLLPLKITINKFRTLFKSESQDKFRKSEWGYTDINFGENVEAFYEEVRGFQVNPNVKIVINDNAIKSLKNIITSARERGVKVVAYFHPLYYQRHNEYIENGSWQTYKEKMSELFLVDDILWDMNTSDYDYLRKEMKYYTSMEHLSQEGADILASVIRDSILSLR